MDQVQEKIKDIIIEVVDYSNATRTQAQEFKNFLTRDIEMGWRKLIVDISNCTFIDSTFLGALVISLKRVTELGGNLKLVGMQPEVSPMFQLTKLDRLFETFETKEEAIKSFS